MAIRRHSPVHAHESGGRSLAWERLKQIIRHSRPSRRTLLSLIILIVASSLVWAVIAFEVREFLAENTRLSSSPLRSFPLGLLILGLGYIFFVSRRLRTAEAQRDESANVASEALTHLESLNAAFVADTVAALVRAETPEEVGNALAGRLRKLFHFDGLSIIEFHADDGDLSLAYGDGRPEVSRWTLGDKRTFKPEMLSLIRESAKHPEGTVIDRIRIEEIAREQPEIIEQVPGWLSIQSLLSAPLVTDDGRLIALLNLVSTSEIGYTEHDREIMARVAKQIAGPVDSSLALRRARQEAKETAITAEIGNLLAENLRDEEALQHAADLLKDLVDYDRLTFLIRDPDSGVLNHFFHAGDDADRVLLNEKTFRPAGEPFSNLATVKSHPVVLNESTRPSLERDCADGIGAIESHGYYSIICLPLPAASRVVGVLGLTSRRRNAYTDSTAELLSRIGNHIGAAVAIAQSEERHRLATEDEAVRLAVLGEIGRIVGSSLDIDEIYDRFAAAASKLIPFDRIVISLIDIEADTVTDAYTFGTAVEETPSGHTDRLSETIVAALVQDPEIRIYSEDDLLAHPTQAGALGHGLRSLLLVPLKWGDSVIGTLSFFSESPAAYDAKLGALAGQVAAQITGAIANAEFHARSMQLASEREARIKLDAENRELQEIERERARFISTISHELRTPLTSISAFSDLLARNKKGHLDERELQQIGLVKKNANRLNTLINDLFDVTKINAGSFELNLQEFDVRQLIQELSESLSPMFSQKRQKLEVSLPDHGVWVRADHDRIAQVVSNLLSNASKYSPDSSQINLELSARDGQVCISVRDRGIGISSRDQRRLFTPFFRADNEETRSVAGTGLGLVITKSIVEMHGGAITLASTPGKGSCFEVRIPNAQTGPSPDHTEKMARLDLPVKPVSRIDAFDEFPANAASSN